MEPRLYAVHCVQ